MSLKIDGEIVGQERVQGPRPAQPGDGPEAGADHHTPVGEYDCPFPFGGAMDEANVRVGLQP